MAPIVQSQNFRLIHFYPSSSPSLLFRPSKFHFLVSRTQCHRRSFTSPHSSFLRVKRRHLIAVPIRASAPSNPVDDGSDGRFGGSSSSTSSGFIGIVIEPLVNFASNNFMPLALVGAVVIGFTNPGLGCLADRYYLSKVSTFCIFIISGLSLRSQELGAAAEAWPVGLFGLVSILVLTPIFSRLILQISILPPEFITGLAIFNCMPTTLSSAVTLTQLAGGNSALALAMTVMSNLLGILVVPFSISKLVADGIGVTVPTKQLFRSLVLTLLVPLITGKILRESIKSVRAFADQNRKLLAVMNALLLSLNPFIQVSKSRSLILMVNPTAFFIISGIGLALHLILLIFNALLIKALSSVTGGSKSSFANDKNATAALLVASQKTLPVSVAVIDQLGGSLGASGLLVLPCVSAHLNQIILDSFLVNSLLRSKLALNASKVP